MGFTSAMGTVAASWLLTKARAIHLIVVLFLIRAIMIGILLWYPVSSATIYSFSAIFGFCSLTIITMVTKYIGVVFGFRYLGTFSAIQFVGHQFGMFVGAYVGGLVYDALKSYTRMFYACFAVSIVGALASLFAKDLAVDLLNPSIETEKRQHKLKRLVQSPNSYFMDVKCPGCFNITTVFSHAQTVVLCSSCATVLCQPTGGRARLTEGCSFRRKLN
ncbi:hypothetical protein INT43_003816 [Umbelopsis isabellina]|uniref:40S ribosomal protein S27 n=1 Tax=Mortierella isabellina TaxID=91625 RepID=A0A8H7PT27_MORIS|nr:hypothetical protein INT43_003816 [Umbelopsis isabellina]